jgi:hypothetical protein
MSASCQNCKGTGRVNDVRTASITHRATTIRRKCRPCQGSGKAPQPVTVPAEPEIGEIPAWMLGEEDEEA